MLEGVRADNDEADRTTAGFAASRPSEERSFRRFDQPVRRRGFALACRRQRQGIAGDRMVARAAALVEERRREGRDQIIEFRGRVAAVLRLVRQ